MGFGIGQSAHRVEDRRFLTGTGRYVGDIDLPGQCHGALVLSTEAHAFFMHVDISAALASPGVRCVLTGADAIADGLGGFPPLFMPEDIGLGPKGYRSLRPVLAADKVRCVGERIAFVVADTAAQARDAAELVVVTYDVLPAVVHPDDALAPGAVAVHEDNPGNECCRVEFGNAAAVEAAFASAAHVISIDLDNQRLTATSIEPRCAIGSFDAASDFYTLYTSCQNPHGARQMIAGAVFHQPESKFRVISPDVGGGFGMKADAYPDDALVLWASRRCGHPVKWVPSRSESLAIDNHGRDQAVHGELALSVDGKIAGVRVRSRHGIGAYVVSAGAQPPMLAVRLVPSVYHVPAFHGVTQAVFTNASPSTVYRGAGRPEAAFLMERLLDEAAVQLGIDAAEIRRRNLITESQLPYATPTGFVYDSGDFSGLLDRCQALGDWQGYEARAQETAARGFVRGRSVVFFIEFAGIFNDRMEIRFNPSGTATILAGTHSHGQGHATTFAQLVAEWLGIPFESIRYVQGDTDAVAYGRGTYAARSSLLASGALREACDTIIDKTKRMAAHLMEASFDDIVFADGMLSVAGSPDRIMPLSAVAKAFFAPAGMPRELGVGLEAVGTADAAPPNFPNGCHICEVEVDPETGFVRIDRYSAVDDVGRAINPEICEGQIQGGLAQGIGQALFEHMAYDRSTGQLLTGTLLDYTIPTATDMPPNGELRLELAEIPCRTNPLGIKGVGESGAIGAPAAVINAIVDALRPFGVTDIAMPATPRRVWEAITAAKGST
jgi:aerobic carbon-monoxide dehydrogenase large subunit